MAAVAMIVGLASAARAQSQDVIFEEPNLAFSSAGPVELESAPRLHMSPELGLRAGYFKPRDADDGEWFGGVQLRLPLAPSLALEGSIELHSSDFADGDIEVIQYPVQATLLVFLFPRRPSAHISSAAWAGTIRGSNSRGSWKASTTRPTTSSAGTWASAFGSGSAVRPP
jgi:hypothetical protein